MMKRTVTLGLLLTLVVSFMIALAGVSKADGGSDTSDVRIITLCYEGSNLVDYINDTGKAQFLEMLIDRFIASTTLKNNSENKSKVAKEINQNFPPASETLLGASIPIIVNGTLYVIDIIPCETVAEETSRIGGGTETDEENGSNEGDFTNQEEERIRQHERGHARVATLTWLVLNCWGKKQEWSPETRRVQWQDITQDAQKKYHDRVGRSLDDPGPESREDLDSHADAANEAVKDALKDAGIEAAIDECFEQATSSLENDEDRDTGDQSCLSDEFHDFANETFGEEGTLLSAWHNHHEVGLQQYDQQNFEAAIENFEAYQTTLRKIQTRLQRDSDGNGTADLQDQFGITEQIRNQLNRVINTFAQSITKYDDFIRLRKLAAQASIRGNTEQAEQLVNQSNQAVEQHVRLTDDTVNTLKDIQELLRALPCKP